MRTERKRGLKWGENVKCIVYTEPDSSIEWQDFPPGSEDNVLTMRDTPK